MNQVVEQHHAQAPHSLRISVLTISDTRTIETDTSGALIVELAEAAGHTVVERIILPDKPERMRPLLEAYRDRPDLDAVLLTGGPGSALATRLLKRSADC